MGTDKGPGTRKSVNSIVNYFTKDTYMIRQKPPLYISEGNHRLIIEFQGKKEDNRIHEFDVNFSVIRDSKNLLGYSVIYKNLTEQKELQELKAQHENLLAKREIAASYVHEIRNPLFSMRGFLQILQQSLSEDDKRREYADIIISELDRMDSLLNGFLAQFRKHSLNETECEDCISINKVIAETITFFQSSFELSGITCETCYSEEDLVILIERDQLMQIFINLIQNAIEAMKKGAVLNIRTYKANGMACVEIKDQGTGIKQGEINRIFDSFYSTKEKGTGLGLYITRRIVNNNGGNIYLESKEGKGTTFYLEFPAKN